MPEPDEIDLRAAEQYANTEVGDGPHVIADDAELLYRAVVPPRNDELDYLGHRMALSMEEARLALGLGEKAMKNAVARGEIPSVKIAGRRLIPVKALERHLEALAYAESGAIDAWHSALIRGVAANNARVRRQAVQRRRYLLARIRKAQRAGVPIDGTQLDLLKADLAELQRQRALGERVENDIVVAIEEAERAAS